MTGDSRLIDDAALDALVHGLMTDGPVVAPRRIAEQAVAAIASTSQRRPLVQAARRRSPAVRWAVAAASIVVAIALSVSIISIGRLPTPSPSATPPTPSATPLPSPTLDPMELVPFVDAAAGFEIRIPRSWGEGESPAAGVRQFRSGIAAPIVLTISVGAADGNVTTCQGGIDDACETVRATSLDALGAALRTTPAEFDPGVPPERSGELTLAGQSGRWKRPGYSPDNEGPLGLGAVRGGGNCLGCPGLLYHAYTLVDGRPVVVSWDFWTLGFRRLSGATASDVMASLRLRE